MSPRAALDDYAGEIWDAARRRPDFRVELHDAIDLPDNRLFLHFRLRSGEGHLLEIRETVEFRNNRLSAIDYSYHIQDPNHALIFRYDRAPHHAGPTFPHHKHIPNAVTPSVKPTIPQAIQEALDAINPTNPARGNPH